MKIDWQQIFDEARCTPGASETEITQLVQSLSQPLTDAEIAAINAQQRNPFPKNHPLYSVYSPFDPARWTMPKYSLPPSFLDFLHWSNGSWCRTGHREFGFFSTKNIREYLLGYEFPEYMPYAVPFALDGGGIFYIFDMRRPPIAGEYPILIASAGNLKYEDAKKIAGSFVKACKGRTPAGHLLYR